MNRRYAKCVVAGDSPAQSLNHLTGNNRTNPRQRFSLTALRRRVPRGRMPFGASKLYRTARQAVILMALAFALFHPLPARSADGKKSAKSPRALGVVQLLPNGKARLIPVTILYDGEFYDASAYKASPVPMALDSGTVYEGFRTGVSQGLFTVTSALQGNNTWVGNGNWQTTSAITAAADAAAKKKAAMSKPAPEAPEGPPVLRRATPKPKSDDTRSSSPPAASAPSTPPASTPAPAPAATSVPPQASPGDGDSDRPVLKRPAPASAPDAPTPVASATPPTAIDPDTVEPKDDPNRPVLKRGAPTAADLKKRNAPMPVSSHAASSAPDTHTKDARKPSAAPEVAATPAQLIPAISDAAGPDPRPYAYSLKPEEEQKLRQKTLAMAAVEVRAWAAQSTDTGSPAPRSSRPSATAKAAQPTFEDVQMHAFDLSNSNEPIIVLTAKARMPAHPNATSDLQYVITLVARDDMYGELHKVFASVTDTLHFDVLSRLELIDAVDADGDGRGELLFRQVSDGGNAFVLYRVIGDKLWPLFQGAPGQ
jgi:hypothetical protein